METKLRNLSLRKRPLRRRTHADGHDYVFIGHKNGTWWRLPKDEIVPVYGADLLVSIIEQLPPPRRTPQAP